MIGDRIKKLRRSLDLTQQAFCERIGIKRNTIAKYETGRGEPIDAVISLICREFNVNEEWLRTGEGEMFRSAASNALDALAAERNLSVGVYVFIEKLLNLKPEYQQVFVDVALEVAAALNDADMSPADLAAPGGVVNTDLDSLLGKHYPVFGAGVSALDLEAVEIAAQITQEKEAEESLFASPGTDGGEKMA